MQPRCKLRAGELGEHDWRLTRRLTPPLETETLSSSLQRSSGRTGVSRRCHSPSAVSCPGEEDARLARQSGVGGGVDLGERGEGCSFQSFQVSLDDGS